MSLAHSVPFQLGNYANVHRRLAGPVEDRFALGRVPQGGVPKRVPVCVPVQRDQLATADPGIRYANRYALLGWLMASLPSDR
ncbi:hypothetical protein GCM10009646_24380 [Streptomyces aureus]